MDSLTALELKNSLQTDLGLVLPSTLAFDYPTVEALLDYLAAQLIENVENIGKAEQAEQGHEQTHLPSEPRDPAEMTEVRADLLQGDALISQLDQTLSDLENLFEEDTP